LGSQLRLRASGRISAVTGDREARIAALVEKVLAEVGDERPTVWQAVTNSGGLSLKRFPTLDLVASMRAAEYMEAEYPLVQALEEVLRAEDEDRPLIMEIAVDGAGETEFFHTFDLSAGQPYSVVLDPTDPDVLRHVESLVREFTDHFVRHRGQAPEFGSVRTEEELAAAEATMGLRLPEDVRALHLLVGDDLRENGLLGRCYLLPLPTVVEDYFDTTPGSVGWQDDLFALERVVFEADPPGVVRRVSRNDWWVAVASDHAGNSFAVDLDPAPGGRSGQLIEYGRDFPGPVGRTAQSVTAVLESVLDALRHDRLRGEGNLPSIVDGVPSWDTPNYLASAPMEGRDTAEVIAELPEAANLQALYLNDAESLDLRALSATPRLRMVSVNRAGSVRLWLPANVEALSLDAREADLSALAGHPTLWDLTVSGLPVSVTDLAALPALAYLDVAGADVDDVEALADLDIRALSLNSAQWQRLRAAGRVPKRLAGARLVEDVRAADALDWTTWLTTLAAPQTTG
jgi:cell wall assembly regulator SMI1